MKTQEITQAVQYDKQHILKKRGLKMSRKLIASERSLIATWRKNAKIKADKLKEWQDMQCTPEWLDKKEANRAKSKIALSIGLILIVLGLIFFSYVPDRMFFNLSLENIYYGLIFAYLLFALFRFPQ